MSEKLAKTTMNIRPGLLARAGAILYNERQESIKAGTRRLARRRQGGNVMTIAQVMQALNAELLTPEAELDTQVHDACGSDMMSDVLAYVKDQAVLLTGLNNLQVVRTAEMMDILCIVFVRGKRPEESLVQMAAQRDIAVLATSLPMFTACGLLYEQGLRGGALA